MSDIVLGIAFLVGLFFARGQVQSVVDTALHGVGNFWVRTGRFAQHNVAARLRSVLWSQLVMCDVVLLFSGWVLYRAGSDLGMGDKWVLYHLVGSIIVNAMLIVSIVRLRGVNPVTQEDWLEALTAYVNARPALLALVNLGQVPDVDALGNPVLDANGNPVLVAATDISQLRPQQQVRVYETVVPANERGQLFVATFGEYGRLDQFVIGTMAFALPIAACGILLGTSAFYTALYDHWQDTHEVNGFASFLWNFVFYEGHVFLRVILPLVDGVILGYLGIVFINGVKFILARLFGGVGGWLEKALRVGARAGLISLPFVTDGAGGNIDQIMSLNEEIVPVRSMAVWLEEVHKPLTSGWAFLAACGLLIPHTGMYLVIMICFLARGLIEYGETRTHPSVDVGPAKKAGIERLARFLGWGVVAFRLGQAAAVLIFPKPAVYVINGALTEANHLARMEWYYALLAIAILAAVGSKFWKKDVGKVEKGLGIAFGVAVLVLIIGGVARFGEGGRPLQADLIHVERVGSTNETATTISAPTASDETSSVSPSGTSGGYMETVGAPPPPAPSYPTYYAPQPQTQPTYAPEPPARPRHRPRRAVAQSDDLEGCSIPGVVCNQN